MARKTTRTVFCAVDDADNPVGGAATNIKPWRTGIRCSDGVIFVATEHQQSGVANLLGKAVLTKAMENYGATQIEGITFAGTAFPLSWYKKLGFKVDEGAVLIKGDCQEILRNLSK